MTEDVAPAKRGFDKSFVFLPGSGNHYAWEPQFEDKEFTLPFMKSNSFMGQKFWLENGEFLDAPKQLPENFYSSKTFTDKLIQYLDERTVEEKEKPFFAYLAYTAPHWPLQAPKEVIDKYGRKHWKTAPTYFTRLY